MHRELFAIILPKYTTVMSGFLVATRVSPEPRAKPPSRYPIHERKYLRHSHTDAIRKPKTPDHDTFATNAIYASNKDCIKRAVVDAPAYIKMTCLQRR